MMGTHYNKSAGMQTCAHREVCVVEFEGFGSPRPVVMVHTIVVRGFGAGDSGCSTGSYLVDVG